MKRLLLIGCLFAAFACTKEPAELSGGDSGPTPPRIVGTPTSGLALKGAISIKLTPEKSSRINGFGLLSAEWGRNVGVCHSIQLSYERIFYCLYSITDTRRKVKQKNGGLHFEGKLVQ